jgi:hypothetical protein
MSEVEKQSPYFDGTVPLVDSNDVEMILSHYRVTSPILDVVPKIINFVDSSDKKRRYVYFDDLSPETKAIVNHEISPGTITDDVYLESARSILSRAQDYVTQMPVDPPKFQVGQRLRIVQDEFGYMANRDLIGKECHLVKTVVRHRSYRYVVSIPGVDRDVTLHDFMLVPLEDES